MRVNVGDVIVLDYYNFEGEKVSGLFVVAYHETYDNPLSSNFTAIKISTKRYCYQVMLETQYLPFLEHTSYLNCNHLFRFRENQVNNIIGKLTPYYMNKMLQQTRNYFSKMERELSYVIGEHNLFRRV